MNIKPLPVDNVPIQELIENSEDTELRENVDEAPIEHDTAIENDGEEKENDFLKGSKEKDTNSARSKEKDLEIQASKRYLARHSKGSYHKSRFTSTWIYQESGGYGYAYGGADPLNYDPSTKNRFIRKLFSITFVILIVTTVVNFCSAKMDLKTFYQEDNCLFVVVTVAVYLFLLNLAATLFECARLFPWKFIAFLLTVIGVCIVSGFFSGRYDTLLVTYMYITQAIVVFALTILAFTGFDFTNLLLHLIGFAVALPFVILFFLVAYFQIIETELSRDAYSTDILVLFFIGTLLSVFIMTAMLQILLRSEAVELSEDDYTLGAFYIYTSLYDIFFKIVQITVVSILGNRSE